MNVGLIGAGHIAHALAEGWSRPDVPRQPSLVFFDVDAAKAGELAAATGGAAAATAAELLMRADLVIVAVRPQHVEDVLRDIGAALGERPVVSVAAGVTLERLQAALPTAARVGRVMPNVAAALGQGLFMLVSGTLGSSVGEVEALFALAGDVVEVDEALFDAATAVAGCMPGIIAHLVAAFAAAGVAHGLAEDVAVQLAVSGVNGAAAIVAREGDPAAVLAAAATPGGMTAAAVEALEERELALTVDIAVAAAIARAKELA
ncbi:MAG: NAD(P)-binding domain-containing protein [Actinobacteria bacterium]|nr:NAD(P)-binding domain-containing protein [Actinomycetota bacterium]